MNEAQRLHDLGRVFVGPGIPPRPEQSQLDNAPMTLPIYRNPPAPLTREDVQHMIPQALTADEVQAMIDAAIDAHTREWIWVSIGGAVALGALLWVVVVWG